MHVQAGSPRPESAAATLCVALVGNPNSGKSTLFNALTGLKQKVANFPGVTVERVEGTYVCNGTRVTVLDVPGTYSLTADSPDEAIALDVLHGCAGGVPPVDVIVVVAAADNLERHLFFASQVLELGHPTVVVLNRMDRAMASGTQIDIPELMHDLDTVVAPVVATRGEGVELLRHIINRAPGLPRPTLRCAADEGAGAPEAQAIAQRYAWIGAVVARCVTRRSAERTTVSDRVDAVLLHPVWGTLIFLGVLLLVFQAMFTGARPLAVGIQSIIDWSGAHIASALPPGELRSLLIGGVLGGVGSVLVFLPNIAILFLFIGMLEDSGYMARAAFAMDKYMRPLGLQGRSFIPLVSGYACAVPAIMATRTIQQREERLATIMAVPLMSCSARLPVYTLLIGAFVHPIAIAGVINLQSVTLLGMYLLGTAAALTAAAVFRRTLLRSATRALIMDLPPYAVPDPRVLVATVWQRVRIFLRSAGTIIFAVSLVLWALASYPKARGASVTADQQLAYSAIGRLGHAIEPAVRPLGYDWKIGVSMIASFAAREVFVSTMGTIYSVSQDGAPAQGGGAASLAERLRAERNPTTGAPIYTPLIAMGLMAFYVLALMCTSTMAMTVRETGGGWRGAGWTALQFGYMLMLAYGMAFLIYRGGLALGFGGGG